MIIAFEKTLINLNFIYAITEVREDGNRLYNNTFIIKFLNNKNIIIGIKGLFLSDEPFKTWLNLSKVEKKKLEDEEMVRFKHAREELVRLWSDNQSPIPQLYPDPKKNK